MKTGNQIRSTYIKSLIEAKNSLEEKMKETVAATTRDILGETITSTLNQMIAESDKEDYKEEEIGIKQTPDKEKKEPVKVIPFEDTKDKQSEGGDVQQDGEMEEHNEDAEDIWKGLEKYQTEDGEYDLTKMGSDEVLKVLKVMGPEDGVRVVKDDDKITLTDDETDREYVIEIGEDYNNSARDEGNEGESDEEETIIEVEPDEDEEVAYNAQPEDEEDEREPDEDPFIEVELEDESDPDEETDSDIEEGTNVGGYVQQNSTSKSHVPNSSSRFARNQSRGGEYDSTDIPRYAPGRVEAVMRKADRIFNENKALKELIPSLKTQIEESILINYCLGKAVKLVTENATSRDEKVDIIKRLGEAKTIDEAKSIYKRLDRELKGSTKVNDIAKIANGQISEARNMVIETPLYQSDDLSEALSLMKRLDNLYKPQE